MKNYLFKWIAALGSSEGAALAKLLNSDAKTYKRRETLIDSMVKTIRSYKTATQKLPFQGFDFDKGREQITENYTKEKLKNFQNDLDYITPLLQKSLISDAIESDKQLKQRLLAREAAKHNFTEGFFYHIQKWEEENKDATENSFENLYDRFLMSYHRFFFPHFNKLKPTEIQGKNLPPRDNLVEIWKNLEKATLVAKLRLGCEFQSRRITLGETVSETITNDIQLHLDQTNLYTEEELPVAHTYKAVYLWLSNDQSTMEDFKVVKKLVFEHISKFSDEEQRSLLTILINILGKLLNGNLKFSEIAEQFLSVAKFGFDKEVFDEGKTISIGMFANICDVAYKAAYSSTPPLGKEAKNLLRDMKDTDVKSFEAEAKNLLRDMKNTYVKTFEASESQILTTYLEARDAFHKKDFKNAEIYADKMHTEGYPFFTIRKKVMKIQALYEQFYFVSNAQRRSYKRNYGTKKGLKDSVLKTIEDLEKTLKNNSLSENIRNSVQSFSKMVRQLIDEQENHYQKLKDNFSTHQNTFAKEWLSQKIEQLNPKKTMPPDFQDGRQVFPNVIK